MTKKTKLSRVQPKLEELLPTAKQRVVFEEASAAREAGRLVRALREQAGLSQVKLAARLRTSQARVSAIESGRGRDGPSYALLKRITYACEVPWVIPRMFSSVSKSVSKALKMSKVE